MWVASLFRGDGEVDEYVMWLQHDVYESALRIIATTCQDHERYARGILGIDGHHVYVRSMDHRALQDAHDILAAAWRYRWELRTRQLSLQFEGETEEEPDFMNRWLAWLRDEVKSWLVRPHLVRAVLEVLHNPHSPEGYEAEARLSWELLEFCGDVDWIPFLRSAVDRQLESPYFIRLPMLLRESLIREQRPDPGLVSEWSAAFGTGDAVVMGRTFNTILLE